MIDAIGIDIRPIEETDPDIADLFYDICNGKKKYGIREVYTKKSTGEILLIPAPVRAVSKVGRNDSCPCGSGKKYKKCCA